MHAARFDTLARLVGTRTSRRVAVGLAASGLLSIAVPEAAAARCSATRPCPACKKCKQHRCKPDVAQNGDPCASGTCQSGVCSPTTDCSATPCSGGRECQEDGSCQCPPSKPHTAPDQNCDFMCHECCIDSHCTGGRHCDIDQGGICVCPGKLHDCEGNGVCWTCCTDQHCAAYGQAPGDGFICTVQHACRCQAGTSACRKGDGTGEFCADLQSDESNCGECGHPCGGLEPRCQAGVCVPV